MASLVDPLLTEASRLLRIGVAGAADAVPLLSDAVRLRPDLDEAHYRLGLALQMLGDHTGAAAAFHQAIELRPDHPDAWNGQGISVLALGRIAEAEACFERAIALRPDHAEAYNNRAATLLAAQRPAAAIADFRLALACRPDYRDASTNLGLALLGQDRPEEALVAFEHVVGLDPTNAAAHGNLGRALQAANRHAQAIGAFERATLLAPGDAAAWDSLGAALQQIGRVDAARRAFEQAVAIAPLTPLLYRRLGECKRFEIGDPHLAAMQAMAETEETLDDPARIDLHFALGKAFDDVGWHADAFQHLLAGNAMVRRQIAYDEAASLAMLDRIGEVCDPALMRAGHRSGDPSNLPVFIVGMPRSGSTLVEQILASHPQVFAAGELATFEAALTNAAGPAGDPATRLETLLHGADDALQRLGAAYVAAVGALAQGAARVTDKMPLNYRFVGLIHLALPNARIIHTRRDPLDTCLSCFSKLFAGPLPSMYDLGELGRAYRAYARLMAHWRAVLPPGVMLDVDYEDLVADLEAGARRIVAHCGLDWHTGCVDFHLNGRAVRTASAAEVRRPLYRSAVGRSQPYAPMLQPLRDALGVIPGA